MRAVVALQLAALLVVGIATVARFPLPAPVDERAHFDVVQTVAEQGRLPVLGRDLISPEAAAVEDGTYPGAPLLPPARRGFGGQSYQAFQPPLYYLVASLPFHLSGDHRHKFFVLRAFNLLLLLGAVALLARLARDVAGRAWPLALSGALAVTLWPGFVARSVTVSNGALELLLVVAFLVVLWRARSHHDGRRLLLAAALLGLALLTKMTTAYLAPLLVAVVAERLVGRRDRRELALAAATLALPLVLLAPWVASNLDRYDAITPNQQAASQQREQYFGGSGPERGPWEALVDNRHLVGGVLPQEWRGAAQPWLGGGAAAVAIAVFAAFALALVLVLSDRSRRPLAVVAAPVLGAVVMVNAVRVLGDQWIYLPRYLYPALLVLALLPGAVAARSPRGRRLWGRTVVVASAVVAGLWFVAAGTFYFTEVGDALGV